MILIVGYGRSGRAAKELLERNNFECVVFDDSASNVKDFYEIAKNCRLVVLSPAVRIDHPLVSIARERGAEIVSEIELAYRFRDRSNVIVGVTGTNGKTTTVSLIDFLIEGEHHLGGNFGFAWSNFCEKKGVQILELSSFQLETISTFRPNISVILNLAPDHIERHGTYEEYVRCKFNILKNQRRDDVLVLNADSTKICDTITNIVPKIYYFSRKKILSRGAFVMNDSIYFSDGELREKVLDLADIKLIGNHNVENVLAAVCVAKLLGQRNEFIKDRVAAFSPPHHRLEKVAEVNGVTFIDDSKGTNVDASLVALNCFEENVIWLLGGSDKGEKFEDLFRSSHRIKRAILFGATRDHLCEAAKNVGFSNFEVFDSIGEAIKHSIKISVPGDTVLLSPACASFDEFSSYEERGKFFCSRVMELRSFFE